MNAGVSKHVAPLGIQPARGQIVLSPPIKNFSLSGSFHFDAGFYYFRNLGNRLLLGGARNKDFDTEATLEIANTKIILQALYDFIQKHLPEAAAFPLEAYQHWSGIMAMHPSKQPVLEQVDSNVWAAMCCNGMGVALSPVFAEKIAAALNNDAL